MVSLGMVNLEVAKPSQLGGSDPDRFDPAEAWYPVFYLQDLDKTKPNAFTLLDIDLVIWWDQATGSWSALRDQCPHRLVPLSEGRIAEDGLLECPYHGWAFTGTGACDRIPQQNPDESANTARRACVQSFATQIAQGLLFIYPGDQSNAAQVPVPAIAPYDPADSTWTCMEIARDLPYDAATLMENVLDASHLPFTHHKSVGNRVNAAPMELELLTSDKTGFTGNWAEGPRKGKLGSQATVFVAPNLMWHDLTSKQFGRTITAVYATPMRKGECRLFARFPFQFSSRIPETFIRLTPRWYSHLGQNAILEDDQIFLHWQERNLVKQGGSEAFSQAFYMPTKADRYVFEFRQWLSTYQAEPFPGQSLPVRKTREVLLDRYESHTKHCTSCRSALAKIRQFQTGAIALAIAATVCTALLSSIPVWNFGLAGLAILSALSAWGLHQLSQRFYHGRITPPRNLS
jgi:phenylpropionate dioxygenase-like ring-hydroxylating dioxygenase large terminal subunit